MILVTGATGQLGQQIVEGLLKQSPSAPHWCERTGPRKGHGFRTTWGTGI